MSSRLKPDNVVFKLWDWLYDDIERCIIAFLSLEDLKSLFAISKKFNKMMTKCVYNKNDFHQRFESVVILAAIKHAIIVEYFENAKKKEAVGHETQLVIKPYMSFQEEKKLIENINLFISKNVTVSKWFLNYLIDNQHNLEYFLFICSPGTCEVFSQFIINCLKTMKPFELTTIKQLNMKCRLKSIAKNERDETDTMDENKKRNEIHKMKNNISNQVLSLKFINLMISFIEEIVPKYWLNLESYWRIFEEFVMFSHEYRYYLNSIEFVSTLGDFYLREQSPYANEIPNEKYCPMGNRFMDPTYSQVVLLISILIRSCHSAATIVRYNKGIEMFNNNNKHFDKNKNELENETCTIEVKEQLINLFKIPKKSLSYWEKQYSFDDYKCYTLLPLSMRDSKLVNTRAFWNEIISDDERPIDHDRKTWIHIYGSEILQHWCFNDIKFSRMMIEVLLQNIENFNHVDACFSMMKTFILMDQDDLLTQRFNMLFNCNSQCIGKTRIDGTNLHSRFVRHHQYGTTIDLIDLIEFYSKSHTKLTFRCIDAIFECIKRNKEFGKLMFKIRDNRWKHWDVRIKKWRSQEIWNHYSSVIESFGVQTQLNDVYN